MIRRDGILFGFLHSPFSLPLFVFIHFLLLFIFFNMTALVSGAFVDAELRA